PGKRRHPLDRPSGIPQCDVPPRAKYSVYRDDRDGNVPARRTGRFPTDGRRGNGGGLSAAGRGGSAADSQPPYRGRPRATLHTPKTPQGREPLNLPRKAAVRWVPFRLKPGDDASCLNLYRPAHPRIIAPPPDFLRTAGWQALEQPVDGSIPAIADANSMTYA